MKGYTDFEDVLKMLAVGIITAFFLLLLFGPLIRSNYDFSDANITITGQSEIDRLNTELSTCEEARDSCLERFWGECEYPNWALLPLYLVGGFVLGFIVYAPLMKRVKQFEVRRKPQEAKKK